MSKLALLLSHAVAVVAAWLWASGLTADQLLAWSESGVAPPAGGYDCRTATQLKPKFLSYDPIVVYIEDFMSAYEVAHLLGLAAPAYANSTVQNAESLKAAEGAGEKEKKNVNDESTRRSQTAWLDDADPVVSCVKQRAAEFQGYASPLTIDNLAALRYKVGGEFTMHYDWHSAVKQDVDRKTSFFAILEDDCEGGGTYFPMVQPAWNMVQVGQTSPWCRFTNCAVTEGIEVKAVKGNAVFWVNFREDGTGHMGTAHAGLPVTNGTKIGMNIWTYAPIPTPDDEITMY